jgi:hypothetical protein
MYIDPNTGGMLFQILATAFVAVSGVFLVFASKIRAGIAKFRRRKEENNDTNETNSK